jgi:two-component system LytT family response regulator
MTLKALIADDEPLARERLRMLLTSDDEIEIAAESRNGREAVAALRNQSIDVLFLDIQMPATDGFEVIEQIGPAHMPVTVFVSAHNHYALKAFEVHALDYLTKPVEPERLRATLAHVKERIASRKALMTQEQMNAVLESLKIGSAAEKTHARRLLVHNGAKDVLIAVAEIEWIEAADYYSCLHVGTKNYLLREPIKQLAATLDPSKFVRVHRSAIVNLDHVREILREGQSEGSITLQSGHRLRMSKVGWQNLLAASRSRG